MLFVCTCVATPTDPVPVARGEAAVLRRAPAGSLAPGPGPGPGPRPAPAAVPVPVPGPGPVAGPGPSPVPVPGPGPGAAPRFGPGTPPAVARHRRRGAGPVPRRAPRHRGTPLGAPDPGTAARLPAPAPVPAPALRIKKEMCKHARTRQNTNAHTLQNMQTLFTHTHITLHPIDVSGRSLFSWVYPTHPKQLPWRCDSSNYKFVRHELSIAFITAFLQHIRFFLGSNFDG